MSTYSLDAPLCVLDTNVVLDLLYWHDPVTEPLSRALKENRLTAVRDTAAMRELTEVLSRERFLGDPDAVIDTVKDWCAHTRPVDETAIETVGASLTVHCRDPLDQKFLTLAVAGRVKYLVSHDKLVLKAGKKLKKFGILTLSPKAFIEHLEKGAL